MGRREIVIYYIVIYYIVQQITLHKNKVFQMTTIPSRAVTFQLRTIFDDHDGVIFTWWWSSGRSSSSAADRSYDSASGGGANWRSAWNFVRINRSKSSCDRRIHISHASTGWVWICNHDHIADTWDRVPRPSRNLRVATFEEVPAERSSRLHLEKYEDDSRVSHEFILLRPWSPDASLDDRDPTRRFSAITKISKLFFVRREGTCGRIKNRKTGMNRKRDS